MLKQISRRLYWNHYCICGRNCNYLQNTRIENNIVRTGHPPGGEGELKYASLIVPKKTKTSILRSKKVLDPVVTYHVHTKTCNVRCGPKSSIRKRENTINHGEIREKGEENEQTIIDLAATNNVKKRKVLQPRNCTRPLCWLNRKDIVSARKRKYLQLTAFGMPPKRRRKKISVRRARNNSGLQQRSETDDVSLPVNGAVCSSLLGEDSLASHAEGDPNTLMEDIKYPIQESCGSEGASFNPDNAQIIEAPNSNSESTGSVPSEGTSDTSSILAQGLHGGDTQSSASQPTRFYGQPRHPIYADINARRTTFIHWSAHLSQTPSELAARGFFYTGTGDLARCYSCGLGLKGWGTGDDPLEEHIKHTRGCQFLLNLLGPDELSRLKEVLQGNTPEDNFTNFSSTGNQGHGGELNDASAATASQGNDLPFVARHPNQILESVRVSTFANWPQGHSQTPTQLSEAGFFYTGVEDICRCFACDGGLRRWDPQDDPWIEHAKWFPHCPHVLQKKGSDFVERVRIMMESSDEEDLPRAPTAFLERSINQISLGGNTDPSKTKQSEAKETKLTPAAQSVMEMGYSKKTVHMAIAELEEKGKKYPTAEEIFEVIIVKEENGEELPQDSPEHSQHGSDSDPDTDDPEALWNENQRLRRNLICVLCEENERNVLTLPCTHRKMCQSCAEGALVCPDPGCGREIKQKIKTYMS